MAATGVVAIVAAPLSGCVLGDSAYSGPPHQASVGLSSPATAPFGASIPNTRVNHPYSFGAIPLCAAGDGTITIDRVLPLNSQGGLEVTAFGTRPLRGDLFGEEPVALSASGFGGSARIQGRCSTSSGGAGSELAVGLRKTAVGNARADGLTITWHGSAGNGQLVIPFHVVLCEDANENVAGCKAL